jgi:hypothetical protein
MDLRARRWLMVGLLAIAAAGAAAVLTTWRAARCPTYEPGQKPMKGEVLHRGLGQPLYFDGHCWTTTPQPPTDLRF